MSGTTNGVIWSAIERFSVQGVSFILSIIISRLVTPAEYGLIAMLAIFMAVSQSFIDSGFGTALTQKKDRDETDFSTVFYFNIVISILLYGLLYLCAPLIARFYNQPDLTEITRWVGLNLILISLSLVQRTRLSISLNFKVQAKVSFVAVILSGLFGVTLAYHGWGAWALVYQTLSNNLLSTIFLWVVAKWRPMLVFSWLSFRRLFSFGSKILASGLLQTIYLNLYSLVIGKFYNPSDVGFYNRAYSISQYPSTNIVYILCRVMYPIQCEHQDDDKWLIDNFIRYLRMACFIVFPLMMLLAVIAKPLVLIVLTEKWLPAASLISILSLAYMWFPVMVINHQILSVKGRSDLYLKAEVIKKTTAIAILFATLPFGIKWLCWGVLIYNLFDVTLIIWFSKKVIATGYIRQFKALLPITIVTAIATMTALPVSDFFPNTWANLLAGSTVFIITFLIGVSIARIDEFKQIRKTLHLR